MFEPSCAPLLFLFRSETAGDITIGNNIDSSFFETGDQIIQTVEMFFVQLCTGTVPPDRKTVVMVMNPDQIESGFDHAVCQTLRPAGLQKLSRIHQIGPVKTDTLAGTVAKLEMTVPHNHGPVFPRRSIQMP